MECHDARSVGKGVRKYLKINVMQLGGPMGLYGLERWILALVRYLSRRKVRSIVSVIKDDPGLEAPLITEAEKLGIDTHTFQAYGRVNFSAVGQLRQYIRRRNVQILHTHGYKQDTIGLLATLGTQCRLISTPHGWSSDAGTTLTLYEGFNRAIFPFFDKVYPLSQDLYDELSVIPLMQPRLELIPNGVDTDEILHHRPIAPELVRWKEEGCFTIGFIGQLIRRKGMDVLLKALAGLPDNFLWRAGLVGDGDQKTALKALAVELGIADRVLFFGFRDNRLDYLKGFDCFVLPSKVEGIPRCLMEAMTAGIPVAASNIPGCADLIIDGQTGRLFPAGDVPALQQVLQDIMTDGRSATKYGIRGRELVLAKFSARRMAKDYERAYVSLAGRSSGIAI
ncbi:MAG TPA: hypothetical protein DHV36_14180 [Desulfobacteraceae bacterium]|nr:hypothetical protein [Desulfobacteraceae bacterium]